MSPRKPARASHNGLDTTLGFDGIFTATIQIMIGSVAARARAFRPPAASTIRQATLVERVPSSLQLSRSILQSRPNTSNHGAAYSTQTPHFLASSVYRPPPSRQVPRPVARSSSEVVRPLIACPQASFLQSSARQSYLAALSRPSPFRKEVGKPYSTKPESKSNIPKSDPNNPPSTTGPIDTLERKSKSLYDRLPHIPSYHRPTKEELLAAATGFWSRLKVRFKWLTIRSVRPFNSDEIGALFSWVLLGHLLWIILGTTTFASLIILAFNTIAAQESLARWVGNYLTKSSGVKVVFESAIVPRWRGGVITFKNVFLSKRPGQNKTKVSKGSPETAAAAAAAAVIDHARAPSSSSDEDTNYTQFDLTLDAVNVTLSFTKWFNGQGLLSDVEIKGVRGVIDRTNVHSTGEAVDPKSYRHEHGPGDFEIDSFKMDDFLVTVHQPSGFRPFTVSVFTCDLPRLRQRWLFYDFLCANNVSGSFDDSLFTIHPRQMHGPATRRQSHQEDGESESLWKKQSRLRIDALKIDHLNRGTDGPFSWIHEGSVDLIADVMFPAESDDGIIAKLLSELQNTKVAMSKQGYDFAENGIAETIETFMAKPPSIESVTQRPEDKRLLVMDLRINFHDVRAAVPLLSRDLSYINHALIRPIVAYINSRNTFIPISCRLAKRVTDLDGSWTLYDSGLLDDLSAETYNAIVRDITDDQARIRRFKKVGLWSLQLAAQALFMGMAGVIA